MGSNCRAALPAGNLALLPAPASSAPAPEATTAAQSPTVTEEKPEPTASAEKPQNADAAASPEKTEQQTCSDLTEDEAVAQDIASVPEMYPESGEATGWVKGSTGTYDPCAELSYVVLALKGGTASSPFQIMFFHNGEYIGTPAKKSFGFFPDVKQPKDGELTVGYRWPGPGESNAEAQVRAVSTYTYNAETGGVDHSGSFPTYGNETADGSMPSDIAVAAGAPVATGGDIPGNAVQGTPRQGEIATFMTEDGNIKCDMSTGDQGTSCVAESLLNGASSGGSVADGTAGMVESKPKYAEAKVYGPQAQLLAQSDGTTVLPAGESVYFGDNVCMAQSNAVSCWSITGTQGFYATADRYITF